MRTPLEMARELARTCGWTTEEFVVHCQEKDFIPPGQRICPKCWELRVEDLFKPAKPNICIFCTNTRLRKHHARVQGKTLDTATRRGAPWSAEDEEYILAHMGDPDQQIAFALHRTFDALRQHRECMGELKKDRVPPGRFVEYRKDVNDNKVSVEQVDGRIEVYTRTDTSDAAILRAFLAAGLTEGIYEEWQQGRIQW